MADPALIKIAVEAAIQVAKDEESRKRLLAIILAPTIFLLILIAFILYLVTSLTSDGYSRTDRQFAKQLRERTPQPYSDLHFP